MAFAEVKILLCKEIDIDIPSLKRMHDIKEIVSDRKRIRTFRPIPIMSTEIKEKSIPRPPPPPPILDLIENENLLNCSVSNVIDLLDVMNDVLPKPMSADDNYMDLNCALKDVINIKDYIRRIIKACKLFESLNTSLGIAEFAYILISLTKLYGGIREKNKHKLIMTALVLYCKLDKDAVPKNKYFAPLLGVSVSELYKLEITILNLMHWNLWKSDPLLWFKTNYPVIHAFIVNV